MNGLETFIKVFGNITVLRVIEIIVAIAFAVGVYIKWRKHISSQAQEKIEREQKENTRDEQIANLQASVDKYPQYRQQSLNIQQQLDTKILNLEQKVDTKIDSLQDTLDGIMKHLKEIDDDRKKRERNRAREELLQGHRMFCDVDKNPMKAWSSLERDSWMARYEDYIECGGNGDMKKRIYPDMCDLIVIHIDDVEKLYELMHSRKL